MKILTKADQEKILTPGITSGKLYNATHSDYGDTYFTIKTNKGDKITVNLGKTGCAHIGGNRWHKK